MRVFFLLLFLAPYASLAMDEVKSLADEYYRRDGVGRLLFLNEIPDISLRNQVEAEVQKRDPEILKKLEKEDLEKLESLRKSISNTIAKENIDDALSAVQNQMKQTHKPCEPISIFDLTTSKKSKIKFEDPKSCEKQLQTKTFFHNSIKDTLKPAELEENPNAEVPLECVHAVMKNFPAKPNYYVGCEVDTSKCPNQKCEISARGFGRPCITEEYTRKIYNDFVDAASCLGISQKEMLPKFFQESGMHINVRGGGGDIGIGQLTGPAVTTVNDSHNRNKPYDFWNRTKGLVLKSDKAACKKISQRVRNFEPTESTRSCDFVAPPDGPLKNIYYSLLNTIRNRSYVAGSLKNQGVAELEKDTALPKFKTGIDKMLVLLSYNAGASTAVIRYATYLQGLKRSNVSLDSEAEVKRRFSFSKHSIENPRPQLKGLKCDDVGIKVQVGDLTFPEYLRLCQGSGFPGYLTKMAEKKKDLDKELGGKCTEQQFLDL